VLRKFSSWLFAGMFVALPAHAVLQIEITQGVEGARPIAIVPFAWNVPVPARDSVDEIIKSDLRASGLFAPIDKKDFIAWPNDSSQVRFADWRALGAENLVVGGVQAIGSILDVRYELLDVLRGQRMIGESYRKEPAGLRSVAHRISDRIYQALTGEQGAFSTRIAYVTVMRDGAGKPAYELQVADYDGFNPQTVVRSKQSILSPAWSPRGDKLAYVSLEQGPAAVYIQDLQTGRRDRLLDTTDQNSGPTWSPDGTKLAIVMSRGGKREIYIVSLAGRTWSRLTSVLPGTFHTEPVWSPDGGYIVYVAGLGGSQAHLYRIDIDGNRSQRISFEGKQNLKPSFSPDGKQLAMVHLDSSGYHIAVLDVTSGAFRILTPAMRGLESPTFAPNGRMILFTEEGGARRTLGAISADGRVKQRLALQEDGDVQEPAWGPFLSP